MSTVSQKENIIERIPSLITDVFGGKEKLEKNAGVLKWQPRFSTGGYIGGITVADMGPNQVMVGEDTHGRCFVAMIITENIPRNKPEAFVICIFQRYGNSPFSWAGATRNTGRLCPGPYYFIDRPTLRPSSARAQDLLDLYQRVVENGFQCYSGFDT